jgi:hypothetical protein
MKIMLMSYTETDSYTCDTIWYLRQEGVESQTKYPF